MLCRIKTDPQYHNSIVNCIPFFTSEYSITNYGFKTISPQRNQEHV